MCRKAAAVAFAALAFAPAAGCAVPPPPPAEHPACLAALADPRLVVRRWIRAAAHGRRPACRLTGPGFHSTTPPFGRFSSALIRPLEPEPGHRLILVLLVNRTRVARYVLDLQPTGEGGWLVDLWAEL